MRQLTETLFKELKDEKGKFHSLLEYVQNDDTLDMEFRGNSFTLYYRGGAILIVEEKEYENPDGEKKYRYKWKGITKKYLLTSKLKHNAKQFEEYLPEAKHIIDRYICFGSKNHLGEKEIQQLVIKENNYSPNSNDTDYFIVDMEYTEGEGKDGTRFDLIAVRWDSNGSARKKDEVSLTIIEVKQGYQSVTSSPSSPGLRTHQKDFEVFVDKKKKEKSLEAFCKDMVEIFKQKCALQLIKGNDRMRRMKIKDWKIEDDIKWSPNIEFICLLANFKDKSRALEIEFIGMDECKFIRSSHMGYGLFANQIFSITPKYPNMKSDYLEYEKKKQAAKLKEYRTSFFNNAQEIGYSRKNNQLYDYILKSQYNANNLYHYIRQDAIDYFKKYDIAWWQCLNESDKPTGHLVSSQIHCLNHLFALRTDDKAVKVIIEKATGMKFDKVLPSIIDKDQKSFISFEFVLDNDKLLGENDEGWGRGTLCTSIDAMVYAQQGDKEWLIPIEWKYTETYKREDKTNKKRIDRYADLIKSSKRLITPKEGIPHSVYFVEPNYELMRQTLLCEQLVAKDYAVNFFHINIIPKGNTELREAVENEFMQMLTKEAKFKIIDPQEFLSPIEEQNLYPELIDYLNKRYW